MTTESNPYPSNQQQERIIERSAENSAAVVGSNQVEDVKILDPLELVYKFLFDPNADYKEINKLWSLTYLSDQDVIEILNLSKNIRIYDQEKFVQTRSVKELVGFDKIQTDRGVIVRPSYRERIISDTRFFEMVQKDLGRIQAICAAAGGRQGRLMRAFRTTTLERHESLEEKTSPPKKKWWGGGGNKDERV